MTLAKRLDRFKLPLTGQEIELQQIDYEGGSMSQLRIRIRERTRFTIVDVDPLTAKHWGEALCGWARDHVPVDSARGEASRAAQRDGGEGR